MMGSGVRSPQPAYAVTAARTSTAGCTSYLPTGYVPPLFEANRAARSRSGEASFLRSPAAPSAIQWQSPYSSTAFGRIASNFAPAFSVTGASRNCLRLASARAITASISSGVSAHIRTWLPRKRFGSHEPFSCGYEAKVKAIRAPVATGHPTRPQRCRCQPVFLRRFP